MELNEAITELEEHGYLLNEWMEHQLQIYLRDTYMHF